MIEVDMGNKFDFLTNVYVADFGDNYHRLADQPSSELEKEARKIRRRYRNTSDYTEALAIYNEYMSFLYDRHGGKHLFKMKLKAELIYDFVPPKPRMKNNERNRTLLKKGIILSKANVLDFDIEEVMAIMEANDPNPGAEIVFDSDVKDKTADEIFKTTTFSDELNKLRNIDNIDYLEEFFNNKNAGGVGKQEKGSDPYSRISVTDIITGRYVKMLPEDTSEEDDVIYYRGSYFKRSEVDDLEVFERLGDVGWNQMKLMRGAGASKRITKLIAGEGKAKQSKKEKEVEKDDFLLHMVMDGDYDSYMDFEKEMLDGSARNILGR